MIALCATCHDHVSRGVLHIEEDDLYRWKGIPRDAAPIAHLFVEPGNAPSLLVGSICCRGDSGVVVFDLSDSLRLSFAVQDDDVMLLSLRIADLHGHAMVEVVDGYVKARDERISLEQRPGHVSVRRTAPVSVLPAWATLCLLAEEPRRRVGDIPILDLLVLEPGLVQVQGIWMDSEKGVVITDDRVAFLDADRPLPLSIMGAGKETVLHFVGPVGTPIFGV